MKPVLSGKLIRWKDERGFGFIQPTDGGQEVFVHITAFKDVNRRPQVGYLIDYQLTVDQKGKISACNASIKAESSSATAPRKKSQSKSGIKFSPLALKTLLLSLLPVSGSIHLALTTNNLVPLILYPVMSCVTFALYADDKSRARQGKRRIPEKTLHLSELIGGWLGGFVAQQILRHKSSKESYQAVFWAIAILHIGFWLQLLWRTKM
jgi:uncharacterized membrane protein YsdA (DUF1294 family)/cold shock CspA family protein